MTVRIKENQLRVGWSMPTLPGNHLTLELGNQLTLKLRNHLTLRLGNHLALMTFRLGNSDGPRHECSLFIVSALRNDNRDTVRLYARDIPDFLR